MTNSSLKHIIRQVLAESVRSEKTKFKQAFLGTYSDYKEMGPRGDGEKEVRLGLKDATKTTSDKEAEDLIVKLGYDITEVIPPGGVGSKTGKYKTYIVKQGDADPFAVVYGSANKGEKFEAELHADLSGVMPAPMGDVFLSSIGLTREDVIEVEPFKAARKRPLTGEINNVGEEISDITIKVQTTKGPKRLFISLKDPAGGTFANQGYSSAFVQNNDGSIVPGDHDLDIFVIALGIDKEKVARGVSDYALDRNSDADICSVQQGDYDAAKISQYLGSALGYGYIYARQSKEGFHIIQLDSPKDTKKLVGNPASVKIRYARQCEDGGRSKGTTATIEMDNGAKYSVAIRNASGKIKPSEMKIQILRYPDPEIDVEDLSESVIRRLLSEELTKSDKKEIERLAKKQAKVMFDKEISSAIEKEMSKKSSNLNKTVNDTITNRFKQAKSDKDFDEAVIRIAKRVLKGLHDMHYKRSNLVDQMPIPKS